MSENNIHELLNRIENSLDSLNTQNISNTFEDNDISNLLRTSLDNIRNNRTSGSGSGSGSGIGIGIGSGSGSGIGIGSGSTTIRIPIGVVRTRLNMDNPDEALGLSEEEFEYLYDYTIYRDTDEKCSICMENFKENNSVIKLDCGHIFHKSCLKTWLYNHKTCPVCRYDITSKFEEYKNLINKLAMYQSIINIIPTILLHNPPIDEEETEETSGLLGWIKWGVKNLGSHFINL